MLVTMVTELFTVMLMGMVRECVTGNIHRNGYGHGCAEERFEG